MISQCFLFCLAYAHKTLRMKGGGQITVPLQAIHIGDFALCAIPFETLVEIGLELKERSPFPRTVVVGIHVDLNPIKAGEVDRPRAARFTSAYQRIEAQT